MECNPKLSILICTTPEREQMTKELILILSNQAVKYGGVEILTDDSPKGSVTIGEKSNRLLLRAKGDYVCRFDSDDLPSDDYISSILDAIEKNPDCIGFKILCDMEGKKEIAASSMKYDWTDNVDGFRYVRSIYHKTPVKREIALKCMFPDKSYSEDYEYSMRLKPHLKSEIFIDKFLYIYRYKYENPITKYGI
jgi:hypothetical protein